MRFIWECNVAMSYFFEHVYWLRPKPNSEYPLIEIAEKDSKWNKYVRIRIFCSGSPPEKLNKILQLTDRWIMF